VEFNRAEDLYVADTLNHCIRRIDGKTGVISTAVGTGAKGYTGDGQAAIEATINEPYATAIDVNDDLYFVDRGNAVVRRVDGRTHVITTVAGTGERGYSGDGGPGTQATLREPNDCCLDGRGGLLIADVADWRIRRLELRTGKITTFAGNGRQQPTPARDQKGDGKAATDATIVGARAVCVDGNGNTYICEREGNAIRRVDSKGVIATIAGTGQRGYAGDGQAALAATFNGPKGIRCDSRGNVYVVDTENHAIRSIDVMSGVITTVAGGRRGEGGDGGPATSAGLDRPHGCIVDAAGNLFIADGGNHRVRKVTP
jgi:streptogramin lyase